MPNKKNNREVNQVSWQAHEFKKYSRSWQWYIGFMSVSLLLIGYGIFFAGIIPSITFALVLLVWFTYAHREPKKVIYTLNNNGIVVDRVLFPYQNILAFWINYLPPDIKTLNFETTAYINRYVSIQLNDQNPLEVREYLLQYLVEDLDQGETLAERITRKTKF